MSVPLKSDHRRHVLKPKIANRPFSPPALLLKPLQLHHTTPKQQVTPPHRSSSSSMPSKWMVASREHLRRHRRQGSIPSQDLETQMSYETPGTCLRECGGMVGCGGQQQRFWHGGAVMGWDSEPAATTRLLMRCPVKNTGIWTLMTTAKCVCSFIPPFSIMLGWGEQHVWAHAVIGWIWELSVLGLPLQHLFSLLIIDSPVTYYCLSVDQ